MQISTTVIESSMEIPQTLEIELPYDPVIPLLDIYPKEHKLGYNRDTCMLMFIAALFTIVKLWKEPRCPTIDEWVKKMWYIYTMEVSQAQEHKDQMFSLICGRQIQKINIYTKLNMIIYKLIYRTCLYSGTTLQNSGKEERKRE
jgi:hypothetical protein